MPISIRLVPSIEEEDVLASLVELLRDTVNGGIPLGFLAPLTHEDAVTYWLSVSAEMQAGSRLLLAAYAGDRIAGSVQLALSKWPNAQHRAEVQKLFVASWLRGRGVGTSLMTALHDAAWQRGRSLLLLNTRHGGNAQTFYEGLHYRVVGVLPGWSIGLDGKRHDHVTLYRELALG
jgi:ribosomal protein S18 acetylase RimI-like enzyme